jgi:hypothetical protein
MKTSLVTLLPNWLSYSYQPPQAVPCVWQVYLRRPCAVLQISFYYKFGVWKSAIQLLHPLSNSPVTLALYRRKLQSSEFEPKDSEQRYRIQIALQNVYLQMTAYNAHYRHKYFLTDVVPIHILL